MPDIPKLVGFAWYREDQYDALKKLFEDGHNLADTYAAWLSQANEGLKHFSAKGETVHKVTIELDEFRAWCASKNCNVDSKARTAFVNWKLFLLWKNTGK